MAWQSLLPAGWPQLPRLLAVPALLSAGGVASDLQQWRQGDAIERPAGGVLVLLAGSCEQRESLVPGSAPKTLAEHCAGSIVGLADYFGEHS